MFSNNRSTQNMAQSWQYHQYTTYTNTKNLNMVTTTKTCTLAVKTFNKAIHSHFSSEGYGRHYTFVVLLWQQAS